jgi:hypothetical protein
MLPDQWHCHQFQGLTAHSFGGLQDDGQDTYMQEHEKSEYL